MHFNFKYWFLFKLGKNLLYSWFFKKLNFSLKICIIGFSFNFSNSDLSLSNKSGVIGYGTMSDNLFRLDLKNNDNHTTMHINENVGIKRCIVNEESSML